ncbi:MAG TPA: squalene--hopene cyclase [Thermoanaerobaculia bacterium]|nr:squalene--hopene cyclase [Thermoanaerobaculia bacterium]
MLRERESAAGAELGQVRDAVQAARDYLLSLQRPDGHWCGELEGDTILESEYALTLYFLERRAGGKFQRLANFLRARQDAHGGWTGFPGGPPEVSASTKAYLVLKLAGDDPAAPHMRAARAAILDRGGLDACNSYTRLLLSMFHLYEWDKAPAVPPEIVLLPRWFYFNIYEMSSWSRAIVVPLSILWASKPSCELPETCRLDELRAPESGAAPSSRSQQSMRERFWRGFFLACDGLIKQIEELGLVPFRARALDRAERWMIERLAGSDGLGAIFPSIMNTVLALVCRGRGVEDALVRSQLDELEKLEIADGDELRLQPCLSPVWDTSLALNSLLESGVSPHDPALERGARWLLEREVRRRGDWTHKNAEAEPSGWYFEYANEFYPDCDDTAEVLALLDRIPFRDAESEGNRRAALDRGRAWLLSMQSRSGGWAAFDKDCDRRILELVPFADHNAMLDPATVDVTSRTIEALIGMGHPPTHPAIRRAVAFLWKEQEVEGCWYGRWGANYIYGTWLALTALRDVGEDLRSPGVRRGFDWLLSCQNEVGGWGESLLSYDDPSLKGRGETTASQTAWAVLGLIAAGALEDGRGAAAVRRGIDWLLAAQRGDGSWYDEHWTGTGFPKVFYLRYHLYACYFPLQALATYLRAMELKLGTGRAA